MRNRDAGLNAVLYAGVMNAIHEGRVCSPLCSLEALLQRLAAEVSFFTGLILRGFCP